MLKKKMIIVSLVLSLLCSSFLSYNLKAESSLSLPSFNESNLRNGFLKDSDGKWKVFNNGKVDTTKNDLQKNQYGWFKVTKGIHDPSYTGLAKNQYGWFYVIKGKVNQSHTGLIKRPEDGKWYYVEKGKWNRSYNGLAKNQYGWFKCKNGEYDPTYIGLAKNKYGWFYVENGKHTTNYTGLADNEYGKFYVINGKHASNFNGDVTDQNLKLYTVKNGKAGLYDNVGGGYAKARAMVDSGQYNGWGCEAVAGAYHDLNGNVVIFYGVYEVDSPRTGDLICYFDAQGNYRHTALFLDGSTALHGNYTPNNEPRIAGVNIYHHHTYLRLGGNISYGKYIQNKAHSQGGNANWLENYYFSR